MLIRCPADVNGEPRPGGGRVDAQGLRLGSGEVDTRVSIEPWESGGQVYGPAPAMAQLVAGQTYELADLLVALTGVAPG